jgi:hypothetical protein
LQDFNWLARTPAGMTGFVLEKNRNCTNSNAALALTAWRKRQGGGGGTPINAKFKYQSSKPRADNHNIW